MAATFRVPRLRAGAGNRFVSAVGLLFASLALCIVASQSECSAPEPQHPKGQVQAWKEHASNPLIRMGRTIPFMLWNDPSVLRDGDTFRMWLSGGDPRNLDRIVVQVFTARSPDGISWGIDPGPCVSPSPDPGRWDSLRIETPSVVKVGGIYHMYYSGTNEKNAQDAIYSIGHATSPDGVKWTKDPANPVIRPQDTDKLRWGYRGVGEPGVVFNPKENMFYLYYVSMRFSETDPTTGHIGILLSRSQDGSRFTHHLDGQGGRALILTRMVEHAASGAWFGYTTPSALITESGEVHLFCAFVVAPKGPATARNVTLDHAVSRNGIDFQVIQQNLIEAGGGDWRDHQVRSPSVVEVNGRLMMWFAGETRRPR